MITKTITALSAVLIIGSASTAFASELSRELNDPILKGTDVAAYQTHRQMLEPRAVVADTEFSGVRRSATAINAAGSAGFDRLTDSTQ